MVCPRLVELDKRHGEHLAGFKYRLDHSDKHEHGPDCGCLIDWEGHSATLLVLPPDSEIADDHEALICRCGRQLVVGEWL
jgi:hypothetical protein